MKQTYLEPMRSYFSLSEMKKWLFRCWSSGVMILLLAFFMAPNSYGQIIAEGATVVANFGIDADVYANYFEVDSAGNDLGIPALGTDDWFVDSAANYSYPLSPGLGVIDQHGADALRTAIQANSNYDFVRRMSKPFNWFDPATGNYWLDAVYSRDNNSAGGNVDGSVFYTGSNKNGEDPSTWDLGPGGTPPKNDLVDVYGHMRQEGEDGDIWGIGGFSTITENGVSHADFEFFANQVTIDGTHLVNTGTEGGHVAWHFDENGISSPGDLIVNVDFENGGTVPHVSLRIWMEETEYLSLVGGPIDGVNFVFTGIFNDEDASGYGYAEIETDAANITTAWGIVNTENSVGGTPWGSLYGKNYNPDYEKLTYAEFALNLSGIGIGSSFGGSDPCNKTLGTLFVKTRSSDSFTAELKDFVGPFLFGFRVETSVQTVSLDTCYSALADQQIDLQRGVVDWDGIGLSFFADSISAVDSTNPLPQIYTLPSTNPDTTYVIWARIRNVDFDDCIAIESFEITVHGDPTCVVTATNETYFGAGNGTATVQPDGGTGPYTYLWFTLDGDTIVDGRTSQTITGLGSGIYQAEITDAFGCTSTCKDTVEFDFSAPTCDVFTIDNDCYGGSSGIAWAEAKEEAGPLATEYTFIWFEGTGPGITPIDTNIFIPSPGDTLATDTLYNLPVGRYTVNIYNNLDPTDFSECGDSIRQPPYDPVIVTCSGITLETCLDQATVNGHFSNWLDTAFTVSGGTAPLDTIYKINGVEVDLDTVVAPDACGGSKTIEMVVTDYCNTTDNCLATFNVPPSTAVEVDGPGDMTVDHCDYTDQQALATAFDTWIDSFVVVSNECGATPTDLSQLTAPDLCDGGSVPVMFALADNCSADTVWATFTVDPSTAVEVDGPGDMTVDHCDYTDQQALATAFDTWIDSFVVVSNECGATPTDLSQLTAPDLCDGGSVPVMFALADNCSADTVWATFTVDPSTAVEVDGPGDMTVDHCDYTDQQALATAFDTWIDSFVVVSNECGATPTDLSQLTAPDLCDGGSVPVMFALADNCSADTVWATFTVDPSTAVEVDGPGDMTVDHCDYTDQQALATAFDTWIDSFVVVSNECGATPTDLSQLTAPDLCDGGSVPVMFALADNCSADTVWATFTVDPSTAVEVDGPGDMTVDHCDYTDQQALATAFDTWIDSFVVVSNECGATPTDLSQLTAPDLCDGGSVPVMFALADNCSADTVWATFTVDPSTAVEVDGPGDMTVDHCDYTDQQALATAFDTWIDSFVVVSNECGATPTDLSQLTAPDLCDGGSVPVMFALADNCSADTVWATFTVDPSTAVEVDGPGDMTVDHCDYTDQQALATAFDTWIDSFVVVSNECGATPTDLSQLTAPDLCDGGSVPVMFALADNCSADTVWATFTVDPSTAVEVDGPGDMTVDHCDYTDQQALATAFDTWIDSFVVVSNECGATPTDLSQLTAPDLCDGGSVPVMFALADNCSADTVWATFTVDPSTAVEVDGPGDMTVDHCDYTDQQALATAFDTWIDSFVVVSNECGATPTDLSQLTAPDLCDGGSVPVMFALADNCSADTVWATFTVDPSTAVEVDGPGDMTVDHCDYTDQQALATAFDTWIDSFVVVSNECGATPTDLSQLTAPDLCDGGSVPVMFALADNCSADTVWATFTVDPSTAVEVDGPGDMTVDHCDYTDQQALATAFDTWIDSFVVVSNECGATPTDLSQLTAPDLCDGGSVPVMFALADNCSADTVWATFTVDPSTAVEVDGPGDMTVDHCDYTDQQALTTAFDTWIDSFVVVSNECGATPTDLSQLTAPDLCDGGSVPVMFALADNCSADTVWATFTVDPSTAVEVDGPGDMTVDHCDYTDQQALATAFDTWIDSFVVVSNECGATPTDLSQLTAPDLCDGGSVPVMFALADNCSADTVWATFTVDPSTAVEVDGPGDMTVDHCDYTDQQALATAFDTWIDSFVVVSNECGATPTDLSQLTAPDLCDGGSVPVMFALADNCSADTVWATFTVDPSTAVEVDGPGDMTVDHCDYTDQQALATAFDTWIDSFVVVSNECGATPTDLSQLTAPDLCDGGSVPVMFALADNCSADTVWATFTVDPSTAVEVDGPGDMTVDHCDYTDQQALATAFDTWIDSFVVVSNECGATPTDLSQLTAPDLCDGGSVPVMFALADNCSADTVWATFTVDPSTAVEVDGPGDMTVDHCDYTDQQALTTAFDTWIDSFVVVSNECGATPTDLSQLTAPDLCDGGSVPVMFALADNCSADTVWATFTVDPSTAVEVDGPGDMTVDHCDYTDQQALATAFDTWIDSFVVVSNECGATPTDLSQLTAPDLCDGGSVPVMFALADNCSADTVWATFTVDPSTAVEVDGPGDMTVDHCDYTDQQALATAFDTWIDSFVVVSNECGATPTDLSQLTAPDLCDGGSVPVMFALADNCSADTVWATFTVDPDTIAPTITVDAFTDSVCNVAVPDTLWASWTDECGGSGELFAVPVPFSAPECEEIYAYTFYAEDDCENSSDTTIYVTRYYDQVGNCETAFGRLAETYTGEEGALCFLDVEGNNDKPLFNRWGWTNRIETRDVQYEMNLYPGAAHCLTDGIEPAGTVYVTWQDDSVHIVYEMNPGQYLDEIHVYVGEVKFPTLSKGKKPKATVAPGQYTITDEDLIVNNGADFWIHDVNYQDGFWIIAHGVVCELTCNCSAPLPEFGGLEQQVGYAIPAAEKKSADILLGVEPILQDSELKVFPNPFDEVVNFEFVPAISGHAVLEIHNMLGQRVVRLLDQPVEAGELQRVEFRPESEISGVYLYRLDIDGDIRIGKLIYRNR